MFRLWSRRLSVLLFLAATCGAIVPLHASQDEPRRGRKYNPPPETAHITVTVVKAANGKPVESAAVVFHPMEGDKDKGNMELKTNGDGVAVIDVIPINSTVRLQVIASGFQTFGEDYQIDGATKEIVVKLKRPVRQYSTYEHVSDPGSSGGNAPDSKTADTKGADSKGSEQKTQDAPAGKPKP